MEVLGHFQPNEATAHNDRLDLGLQTLYSLRLDAVAVGHIAQGEDIGQVNARHGRHNGKRTGREQEHIVPFLILLSVAQVLHRNNLPVAVDGRHLVEGAHIHIVAVAKRHWGLDKQFLAVLNRVADIIGQTAIGVRDMLALFEEDNLRVLVESFQAGGGGSASRHAAHNHIFHSIILIYFLMNRLVITPSEVEIRAKYIPAA